MAQLLTIWRHEEIKQKLHDIRVIPGMPKMVNNAVHGRFQTGDAVMEVVDAIIDDYFVVIASTIAILSFANRFKALTIGHQGRTSGGFDPVL